MPIPLVDLGTQYQTIKHEIKTAIEDVLENMQLFLGPQLQAFETEFAVYCDCRYAVGVASGTDALTLALRACDIGPGDEVISASNTFIATVEAIALVGATPAFIDIDPLTYTMDWRQLDSVLTSRTRAIIPVHLCGHPVEMQPVLDFACSHSLRVIEDASHDTNPAEMLKIYNKGADVHTDPGVSYRFGEITIRLGTRPRARGAAGLAVVQVLAAVQEALEEQLTNSKQGVN